MDISQRFLYIVGIGALVIGLGVLALLYLSYVNQSQESQQAPLYTQDEATTEAPETEETDGWVVYEAPLKTELLGITPLGPETFFAVGTKGIMLRSTDAGASWRALSTTTTTPLYATDFFEDTRGIAVGELPEAQYVQSETTTEEATSETATSEVETMQPHGMIVYSADQGSSWQSATYPETSGIFFGVAYYNDSWITAVGDTGKILTSADRGETWSPVQVSAFVPDDTEATSEEVTPQSATSESATITDRLYDVSVGPISTGLIVGAGGAVIRTTDQGDSWEYMTPTLADALQEYTWYGALVVNRVTFIAVGEGGRVLRSSDQGASWELVTTPTDRHLYAVTFVGPDTGYAVGSGGVILKTVDRGLTWTKEEQVTEQTLTDITTTDRAVIAVGTGGTIVVLER